MSAVKDSGSRDSLTGESVLRSLLTFSVPFLISSFLQTFYGLADLFITGQFNGAASITAVSIGSQLMHMLTVMIVGLAMGTTVMIGHSVGAKKPEETARAIGTPSRFFPCAPSSPPFFFCALPRGSSRCWPRRRKLFPRRKSM